VVLLVNFLSVVLVLIGTLLGAVGALVIKQGVGGKSIRNFFLLRILLLVFFYMVFLLFCILLL